MAGIPYGVSTDPQAPREIDAAIAPGVTLGGRYQVRRRLGGGGMGSVWRVHDHCTGEDVALKVLLPHSGTDALVRFRREVTLARRIAHPNVCRVFDLGAPDNLHVLTMELIEGESLRARLARGPLSWVEARRLVDDILAGLAAVHAAEVVHRDIKPENILIACDGRAVLVDFGLAWAPTTQVSTAPEVGTPQYMSPEQLSGGAIDPRSDVFAAGMAIQEILDGRPPFEGATVALVASAILRDQPRPLEGKEVPANARSAAAQVIARALSRDPAARQADASELRKEWLTALGGVPATRSLLDGAPAPRSGARMRVVIGTGVAALGLIGATAAVTLLMSSHSGRPPAESLTVTSAAGLDRDPTAHPALGPQGSVFMKPAWFTIVPPWAAGKSHTILQAYGTYEHQNTNSRTSPNDFHALDFDLEAGEAVYPIASGTIIYAGPTSGEWAGYGNIVFIDHLVGGLNYQSLYAHLSSVADLSGPVTPDTMIGHAGSTGTWRPTLHLAIFRSSGFALRKKFGTGPYGGETVIPEPFASCAKLSRTCEGFAVGDVLKKLPSSR